MSDRLLSLGMTVSVVVHGLILLGLSLNGGMTFKVKPVKSVALTYQALKPRAVPKLASNSKEIGLRKQPRPPREFKSLPFKDTFLSPSAKGVADLSKISKRGRSDRKLTPKLKTLDLNRKITVPVFRSEKISNPKYLSYHENIRQRIKEHAYDFIDHPNFAPGQVYLTFIVAANGALQGINVIDDKTSATLGLKNIGKLSIKESSPFPPFPVDLTYPELTFNVVISFEMEE